MHAHPGASSELRAIVAWAISEAEMSCEYGVPSDDLSDASKLADAAHEILQDLDDALPAMTAAVACWVAKAAQYPDKVSASSSYGASAAVQRYLGETREVQADFRRLTEFSQAQDWTDRSPVSSTTFPPLPPFDLEEKLARQKRSSTTE
ncbi:hypothetical protein LOC68_19310 [Blastopirellula sp. JC732]|uniref:Uncharacterized protein n=1 Tax=Blastopirellula sediminis TaxID=2894196 RepID=A0A9X1SGV0_9BACT|nr:hypothetical protein [Blastopirellula sediminis]MCC9606151.1 hypothetical protein [Blastopirellula sediminis]MCC9630550.1 hypothetical protein [Blastopirellula sediminis]